MDYLPYSIELGRAWVNDYKIVNSFIKTLGLFVPPLISAYLRLAKKMVSFGSTLNPELENSFETGIMVDVNDIYPEKYARYIQVSSLNETVCRGIAFRKCEL